MFIKKCLWFFAALIAAVSSVTYAATDCPPLAREKDAVIAALKTPNLDSATLYFNKTLEPATLYFKKARDCFLEAAAEDRRMAAVAVWSLGSIQLLRGDYRAAEIYFLQAAHTDPENSEYQKDAVKARNLLHADGRARSGVIRAGK